MSSWRRRPAGTAPEAEGKLVPCPRPPPAPRPAGRISSVLVNAPDVYAHIYTRAYKSDTPQETFRHFAPLLIHASPSPSPSFRIFMTHRAVLFVSSFSLLYGYNISSWKIANVINLTRDWTIRNDIRYLILSILNFSKFAKKDLRCIVILYLYIYCCRDIKFYPRKLKISIAGGIGSVNEGTKGIYYYGVDFDD